MAIESLADSDHIVRHVPKKLLDDTGKPLPQAYELRAEEEYLSASWLERYAGSRVSKICGVTSQICRTRTVKPADVLSIGNVGNIKNACSDAGQKIRITYEPLDKNRAYTAVRRIKTDNLQLLERLAQEVWCDNTTAAQSLQSLGPWDET